MPRNHALNRRGPPKNTEGVTGALRHRRWAQHPCSHPRQHPWGVICRLQGGEGSAPGGKPNPTAWCSAPGARWGARRAPGARGRVWGARAGGQGVHGVCVAGGARGRRAAQRTRTCRLGLGGCRCLAPRPRASPCVPVPRAVSQAAAGAAGAARPPISCRPQPLAPARFLSEAAAIFGRRLGESRIPQPLGGRRGGATRHVRQPPRARGHGRGGPRRPPVPSPLVNPISIRPRGSPTGLGGRRVGAEPPPRWYRGGAGQDLAALLGAGRQRRVPSVPASAPGTCPRHGPAGTSPVPAPAPTSPAAAAPPCHAPPPSPAPCALTHPKK